MRFLALAFWCASLAPAQVVEGVTLDSITGAPIAGVKVQLAQGEKAGPTATSDSQGRFRFDALADGDYAAEFSCEGFRQPGRAAPARRPFHVTSGGPPVHLEVAMLRLANVSGRVTASGKPIAHADVQLLIAGNFAGQVERTDEKGEFRFHDVDPGTYVLSARPTKGSPAPEERDGQKLAWVRTWYPAAGDRFGAAKVVVSAGADLIGQEISLRAVPAHRVQGLVLSPEGQPVAGATVKAAPPEEFAVAEFELQTATDSKGSFEFKTLPEGNWRITAEGEISAVKFYAAAMETIEGRDVDRLELRFVAPFTLSGKVVRPQTGVEAEKKSIGIMLAPREGGYRMSWAATAEDGSFQIQNLAQGTYRFQPTAPGPPYYLASIEMNGRDVTGQYVEIVPTGSPVTITYRTDGGTVRGTVEDCGSATIVLAPQDPQLQYAEFIRQAKCGQGGRFEITAVRPGDYYAFAFDQAPGMLELSSFAGQLASLATRVTVRAGEATDASLKVTQRGPF